MTAKLTWVLVADGSRARLFRLSEPAWTLAPATDEEFVATNLPSREIGSDRPGRTFDSAGPGRHAMQPPTDPHRHAKAEFARAVVRALDERHERREFARLIVVAPPQVLGDLRAAMPSGLREAVRAEIDKDLTKLPPDRLAAHLREALAG